MLSVDNTDKEIKDVLNLIEQHAESVRVFTFDFGNNSSVDICKKIAIKGRGTCNVVGKSKADLTSMVIQAM